MNAEKPGLLAALSAFILLSPLDARPAMRHFPVSQPPDAKARNNARLTLILTSVIVMYFNYLGERSWLVDAGVWASFALTVISAADYFLRLRLLINAPPPTAST